MVESTDWPRTNPVLTATEPLAERPPSRIMSSDLAASKCCNRAYDGASWGAAMGSLLPAVDDRLRALVLLVPGFYLQKCLPEVDQLNFAPRMKNVEWTFRFH